jgi:hypothetical protein
MRALIVESPASQVGNTLRNAPAEDIGLLPIARRLQHRVAHATEEQAELKLVIVRTGAVCG